MEPLKDAALPDPHTLTVVRIRAREAVWGNAIGW